jgi:hypothetical protein
MFGHPYAILRTPTRYPFIAIFEPCLILLGTFLQKRRQQYLVKSTRR